MDAPLTHADLRQFTGDLERFRHPLAHGVIYTPGIRYLAQCAEAYWLIDEIALAIAGGDVVRAGKTDERVLSLHFWRLEVREDRSAMLTARADEGVPPFVTRHIPWTDLTSRWTTWTCGPASTAATGRSTCPPNTEGFVPPIFSDVRQRAPFPLFFSCASSPRCLPAP